MSFSNLVTEQFYAGNSSTTSFPIPFIFQINSQVKVAAIVGSVDPVNQTLLVEGTDYNITGGNPGITVVATSAPAAGTNWRVYRDTPKVQSTDYIETGLFKATDHESTLDRLVMMVQEIARDALRAVTVVTNDGVYTRLVAQAVSNNDTITNGAYSRILKGIYGYGGSATVANASTVVTDGTIDGQELRLVGASDSATVTLVTGGNCKLQGNFTLTQYAVLDLFWSTADNAWIESGRSI